MSRDLAIQHADQQALALAADPEQRVQNAKRQLAQHLVALDQRARLLTRQTLWIAGGVLLGVVATAAVSTLLHAATHTRARGDHAQRTRTHRAPGLRSALLLAGLSLLNRRWQHLAPTAFGGHQER